MAELFPAMSGSGGGVTSATIANGGDTTLGSQADPKSTATDTTPISAMSVLKEISASVQTTAAGASSPTDDSISGALNSIARLLQGIEYRLAELPLNLAVALNQTLNLNGGAIRYTGADAFETFERSSSNLLNN